MADLICTDLHPLADANWRSHCREQLGQHGALVLRQFLQPAVLQTIVKEATDLHHLSFQTDKKHNVYMMQPDEAYDVDHPRNREVLTTSSYITDDLIPTNSPLRQLYNHALFKSFLCDVLGEKMVYPFADTLSSINIHYVSEGQELGWHFDTSSFAITLLVQKPRSGGEFQYVKNLRSLDDDGMNYNGVVAALDNCLPVNSLALEAGDLVLFRGHNSLHRVTPTEGDITRMLTVLAYNTKPGVALPENKRLKFYGRVGKLK